MKHVLISLGLGAVLGGCVVLMAQDGKIPALDALDKQAIELATEATVAANKACAGLSEYKHYEKTRTFVNAAITAKYPGYVLNWQTAKLEPVKVEVKK